MARPGRPLKFASLPKLRAAIDAYFAKCDKTKEPYTITGLALALKTSRETLMNYEKREQFFDTIKEAKVKVENYAEKKLFAGNPAGPIFSLKNFGWTDKQQVDHTNDGQPFVLPGEIINKNNLGAPNPGSDEDRS